MADFNFLKGKTEYKEIERLCLKATGGSPSDMAVACRKALGEIIFFIYEKHGVTVPEKATMLELIDSKIVSPFIGNAIIVESLHFIRKLGINAEHGIHIKKNQSKLALENLAFFAEFVFRKFSAPETVPDIVIPKYLSEADTRKIYIDLYSENLDGMFSNQSALPFCPEESLLPPVMLCRKRPAAKFPSAVCPENQE